jgi:hypothetical protein
MINVISHSERWAEWKKVNADKLKHPVDYERKFVDLVLSQISSLKPDDVIPQYPFVDSGGRHRRIDFVIQNEDKGWFLPIELDVNKGAKYPEKWSDSLDRQNDLLRIYNVLLRYSNDKMLNNSKAIIEEIERELLTQTANKRSRDRHDEVLRTIANGAVFAPQPAPSVGHGIGRKTTLLLGIAIPVVGLAAWAISQQSIFSAAWRPNFVAIAASQAGAHVGERKVVCGIIASLNEVPSARFFNFDRRFPNQTMTIVMWRRDYAAVGKLDVSEGDNFCVEGVIEQHEGKPRVQLSDRRQIVR